MRYACLIYFDPRKVFDRSVEAETVLRDSGSFNKQLRASGHLVTDQALQLPDQAMTVQVRNGKMSSTDGPFMETKEMLGGFIIIEARDLNEAVRIAAEIPLAKLGSVEVRPVVDFSKPRPQL
ncbi:MAG: YciI family protein [Burkholderiales bacterium]|nr:YciI family protein [Burkholderiales bacterium]